MNLRELSIMVLLVVASMEGLFAFVCSPLYGSPSFTPVQAARTKPPSCLFMVSKKEKQRQREEQERIEALQSTDIEIQQHALVGKLLEIKKAKKSNSKEGAAVQKLLKNAAHDGLVDIGSEARRLALEISYAANRPSDVLMVLSSMASSKEERDFQQLGLWAHSMLNDLDSAAPFAELLYEEADDQEAETGAFFSAREEQNQLRLWAIQAFCHTGQHVDMARDKLWKPKQDGPEITNAFLQSYIRKQSFQKAKELWGKWKDDTIIMDQESYRLLFQCGFQCGDIPLTRGAMKELKSITEEDSLLFLQATTNTKTPLDAKDQALVATTFQSVLAGEGKGTKKKAHRLLREPKGILSQLLVTLDRPSALISIFETCQKSNYFSKNWFMSLTPAAKAKVLPILFMKTKLAASSPTAKEEEDSMEEQAWELLVSIFKIDFKNVRAFLRGQSPEFCAAALVLSFENGTRWNEQNGYQYSQLIVEESWDKLIMVSPQALPGGSEKEGTEIALYDRKETASHLLSALPLMYGYNQTSLQVELFQKIVMKLTEQVERQMVPSSKSP